MAWHSCVALSVFLHRLFVMGKLTVLINQTKIIVAYQIRAVIGGSLGIKRAECIKYVSKDFLSTNQCYKIRRPV